MLDKLPSDYIYISLSAVNCPLLKEGIYHFLSCSLNMSSVLFIFRSTLLLSPVKSDSILRKCSCFSFARLINGKILAIKPTCCQESGGRCGRCQSGLLGFYQPISWIVPIRGVLDPLYLGVSKLTHFWEFYLIAASLIQRTWKKGANQR